MDVVVVVAVVFENSTAVWTFGVAFLHQATANFARKEFLVALGGFAQLLSDTVLRAEHGDGAGEIVTLQGEFGLNRVFKGLGQVVRGVQDTTVVNVGDVHHELVVLEFGLRRFHGDASLAGHAADSHL